MAIFQRHQLQKDGDSYTLILYLDPGMTEFADEIGQNKDGAKEKLESSVTSYIREKFPNLKVKVAKVMLGGMMVASIPIGAMSAAAADVDATPISTPVYTTQAQLPDVQGTKFEKAVNMLSTIGVIAGKDDGKYHAEDSISRAEFAKFAVYAAGLGPEAEKLTNVNAGFGDVKPDYWAAKYIKVAKDHGLMQGVGYNQFNPLGDITYEEVVTVLQRIQGYNDENLGGTWPSNYVNLATQNGIGQNTDFAQGKIADRGNVALLLNNILQKSTVAYDSATNQFQEQGTTLFERAFGDRFMLIDGVAYAIDQAPYSIDLSAANSAKSLKLTFNKPVINTDAVDFIVKRGASTVSLNPVWSADKMSVVLQSDVKLSAGNYTVTVEGLDDEGKREATIAVQAERIAAIEVIGDKLIKVDDGDESTTHTLAATYKVLNQYNEDITRDPLANTITWTVSTSLQSGKSIKIENGKLTIPVSTDLQTGTPVVLTGIDGKTGTVVTKTLQVADMAHVATMKFGQVIYHQGQDKVYAGGETYRIPFEAYDQYGNRITDTTTLNTAVNSYLTAGDKVGFVEEDGETYFEFTTPATAQKMVITTVAVATGTTTNVTVEVVSKPAPADVVLGSYDKVIAAGDASNSIAIPITVFDQFGNALTPAQIASMAGEITVTASGALSDADLTIATTGVNKGKIVNTSAVGNTTGPSIVMVTIPKTGKTQMMTVTVSEQRAITDIVAPKNVSTNLLQGADQTVKFQFVDQYGEVIDLEDLDNDVLAEFSYEITMKKLSGDDGAIVIDQDLTGADITTLENIKVSAASGKTGSYRITASLKKGDSTISQSALTFNSYEATSDLIYTIADLPKMYGGAKAESDDEAYALPLSITATDANGNEYVINPESIISVTDTQGVLEYDKSEGLLYIAAGKTIEKDVTTTLKVVFNTKDEVKTIDKQVNISAEAPIIQSFSLVSSATAPTDLSANFPAGAKTLDSLTGTVDADGKVTFTDATPYLVGQDQYGIYHLIDEADLVGNGVTVSNLSGVTVDKSNITLEDGKLTISDVTMDKNSGSFRIIMTNKTGAVAYYNVNLTKDVT